MFATVPVAYRSLPVGACRSGSCCNRKPIFRLLRTASCAAASERSRLIATGTTVPGNSTRLRTGTMISMSSDTVEAATALSASAFEPASLRSESFIRKLRSAQPEVQDQASVRVTSLRQLVFRRGQRNAPLEAPVRNLQPMQRGRMALDRQRTRCLHHDQAVLRIDVDVLRRDTR